MRKTIVNGGYPSGVGSIIIPQNSDRDKFVENALRTEKVSILGEDGSTVIHNAYVLNNVLQDIYFPPSSDYLGSRVTYLQIFPQQEIVVVGVITNNEESQLLGEYDFKRERTSPEGLVSVIGQGKFGEMFININSSNEKGGNLFINVSNEKSKSKVNLSVKGDINVYAEGNVTIEATKSINLNIHGKKTSISIDESGEIKLNPETKFSVGTGTDALIKGTKSLTELNRAKGRVNRIIEALKTSPVVSGDGGASYKAAIITALENLVEEDYSDILSKKTFIE